MTGLFIIIITLIAIFTWTVLISICSFWKNISLVLTYIYYVNFVLPSIVKNNFSFGFMVALNYGLLATNLFQFSLSSFSQEK